MQRKIDAEDIIVSISVMEAHIKIIFDFPSPFLKFCKDEAVENI